MRYDKDRVYMEPYENSPRLRHGYRGIKMKRHTSYWSDVEDFNEIDPRYSQKVIKNFAESTDICNHRNGGHLSDTIFHS